MNHLLIDPCLSDKFSPNFYRWVKNTRIFNKPVEGFFVGQGSTHLLHRLYCGSATEDNFIGAAVSRILCCYPGMRKPTVFSQDVTHPDGVVPDPELWTRYLEIGSCLFDPDHIDIYPDRPRYKEEKDHRTCLWCGAEFRLDTRKITKTVTRWVPHTPVAV